MQNVSAAGPSRCRGTVPLSHVRGRAARAPFGASRFGRGGPVWKRAPCPDWVNVYMDSDEISGVIATDVRPGGALTALLAALPSLLDEEWRSSVAADDPHCRYLLDLTDW